MSHDEVDRPSEQPLLSEEERRRQAQPQERIAVITGGFSNDDCVYLIHAGTGTDDFTDIVAGRHRHRHPRWEMKQINPYKGTSFVYGATLTALPTQYTQTTRSDVHTLPPRLLATMRAIRFGGFRAGGYSNETSQVSMLTVEQEGTPIRRRQQRRRGQRQRQPKNSDGDDRDIDSDDDHDDATWEWQWQWQWEAYWSDVATTGIAPDDNDDEDSSDRDFLSRAYHTSTLLLDRYLVVIGGMKSTESVLNEAILDTKTWTWFGNGSMICDSDSNSSSIHSRPSGRHGHSVVLDDTRNRLVLFGGGSGSDLLRSGEDNSEVWELQFGDNWRESDDMFVESFPWKWKKLHDDSNNKNNNDGDDEETNGDTDDDDNAAGAFSSSKLSPSETLCLGRCHNCIKISRDTVLLLFGSGRPTTNGMVAYDLKTDTFFRQHQSQSSSSSSAPVTATASGAVHIKGILPKPRFTGVAAFLEEDGYIVTHGGYCGQEQDTIGTMDVLDLAPGFRRPDQPFVGLAIDDRRVSYEEVTDVQAERGRRDPDAVFQRMLQTLMNNPIDERQAAAGVMLNQMNMGEHPSNGQSLLLMSMIANGHPLLIGDNEDEDENDEDAEDEHNEADMDDSD